MRHLNMRLPIGGRLLRNTAVMYGSAVGSGGIQYVSLILLARTVGPSRLGVVVLATTIGSLTTAAVEFGIGPVLVRYRPQLEDTDFEVWSAVVRALRKMVIVSSAIICFVGAALGFAASVVASSGGVLEVLAFGAAIAAPTAFMTFCQSYLQSERRFASIAAIAVASATLRLAIIAFLAVDGALTAYTALGAYAVVALLAAGYAWAISLRRVRLASASQPAAALARKLIFPYLRWTMVARSTAAVSGRLDIVLLSALAGARSTGVYGAASQSATPMPMLATAVGEVSFPHLVRRDPSRTNQALVSKWAALLPVMVAVGLGCAFAGRVALPLLLGRRFQSAVTPFEVLVVAYALQVWLQPIGSMLYASDRQKMVAAINAGQTVMLLVFDLMLIPLLGPTGPAVAILLMTLISGPVMVNAAIRDRSKGGGGMPVAAAGEP